jgi:hypothetical protein
MHRQTGIVPLLGMMILFDRRSQGNFTAILATASRLAADYRAGASERCTLRTHGLWIVARARMLEYSANGTFRIILLVARRSLNKNQDKTAFNRR